MQPSNGQLSDNDSDTEEGTDVQHFSAGQLRAPADFRIDFVSYIADSILTQEEKLQNFDEEECRSKDKPSHNSNPMNLANEKWLSQKIPPKQNCNWKKEDISDTHFDDIQMAMPIIQQNVTHVGLFEQFFDDNVIAFIVNMSTLYAKRDKGKHKIQN